MTEMDDGRLGDTALDDIEITTGDCLDDPTGTHCLKYYISIGCSRAVPVKVIRP